MAEEQNNIQENNNRALDTLREYPLAPSSYYGLQEEEIHLRDYLHIILRRKWIVITFFIAVVTTVTLGTFMMKPQYKSTVSMPMRPRLPFNAFDIAPFVNLHGIGKNLVAIKTGCSISLMNCPSSISERPFPYTSAVSTKRMPSSRAVVKAARISSSVWVCP